MRVLLLSVCVAISMSACAKPISVPAPPAQIIEDLGWTSKTVVKPAAAENETNPAAKPSKVQAARKSKPARQAKAAASAAPDGAGATADKRDHLAGACSKLTKDHCTSGCKWVVADIAGKADAEGYCTAARSF